MYSNFLLFSQLCYNIIIASEGEEKKQAFLKSLENKKKEILEKNKTELHEISSNRHDIIKKAQTKAKKQALDTINSYQEKTKLLEKSSKNKIEEAINLIFQEFLSQNV